MSFHRSNTEVVGVSSDGFHILRILTGQFEGVEYSYGEVALDEVNGEGILKFETTLHSAHNVSESDDFKKLTGDILMSILEEQLLHREVVYHGGSGEETLIVEK